ncbi:DNA polymerase zeta subunit [Cryptococcus neoformans]|nr:DNA polymerase zeta subunit [Cryptococcus neoformans var. grubii Th84]OXH16333.1 DNA polymerase zeta subunit [Cryptococcus neoformans var. grubii]OXH36349.1 DNA polymerase zeta subunit [Cryptococcus neoformans var. grubii]OXH57263.1 DNA polymerase zeta subunit [Cryptococcus neoformans var. grubii]OXH57614.1 DNA polymerase zeta subunit [Cryptococcus neoformans var. grubii]
MEDTAVVNQGPSSSLPVGSTQSLSLSSPFLRVKITHIISDQAAPIPTLRQHYAPSRLATAIPLGNLPHSVPVIRIFGTTSSSQKICANIHLCYPYFFVPYPMDSQDPLRPERVVKLCQRFAVSLNHAICLALRQNPTSAANNTNYGGGVDPKHLHVVSVILVKGTPFYGYHLGYDYFLKINLANPARLHIALEQLRKPNVLGREWQPHEAHLNHVLQFMCDFDLYGCGWLELGGGTFREPVPEGDPYDSLSETVTNGTLGLLNSRTVPTSMLYPPGLSPVKNTFTSLEIDILPHQVLNRQRLIPRLLHHDFIELLHKPLDPNEKLVPAVAELWEDERRRRAAQGLGTGTNDMMPGSGGMEGRSMEELGYRGDGMDGEKNKGGNWKISDELWAILEERMGVERKRKGKLSFQKYSRDVSAGKDGEKLQWDKWIMTTFDALSAHWPKQVRKVTKTTQKPRKSHMSPPAGTLAIYHRSSPDRNAQFGESTSVSFEETGMGSTLEKEDEEINPFEAFAMTQASQHPQPMPELSQHVQAVPFNDVDDYDQYYVGEDEGDIDEDKQAERARAHAQETDKIRATQMATEMEGHYDEYDDKELEELFRQTVAAGLGVQSEPTTPHKPKGKDQEGNGRWSGWTPTSKGSSTSSVGTFESRKRKRNQRLLEEAGLGDLSTIIDRSSLSLSPLKNPYDERGHVLSSPRKVSTPSRQMATPSSLMRNAFAKSRQQSPNLSPTKRSESSRNKHLRSDTVILPSERKNPGAITSSPSLSPKDKIIDNDHGNLQIKLAEAKEPPQGQSPPAFAKKDLIFGPEPGLEAVQLSLPPAGAGLYEPIANGVWPVVTSSSHHTEVARTTEIVGSHLSPTLLNPSSKGKTSDVPLSATLLNAPSGKPALSPTFQDPSANLFHERRPISPSIAATHREGREANVRPHKRVKLTEPGHASQESLLPLIRTFSHPSHGDRRRSPQNAASDNQENLLSSLASKAWQYYTLPPRRHEIANTMELHGVPTVDYQPPFFGQLADVPARPKTLAGRVFNLKSNSMRNLQKFESTVGSGPMLKNAKDKTRAEAGWLKTNSSNDSVEKVRWGLGWEYAPWPPSKREVKRWCEKIEDEAKIAREKYEEKTSQLAHPTQKSKYGFKYSQKQKVRDSSGDPQNMSILTMEVFAQSRGSLLPDPEKDAVTAIFYCYSNTDDDLPDTTIYPGYHAGYVVIGALANPARLRLDDIPFEVVEDELALINWVIDTVKFWDPDVLAGWELHNSSWGYLAARASGEFAMDMMDQISRVISGKTGPRNDGYSAHHSSTFKVTGRHTLNIWRICRSEINLTQYTFENVVFHLLHQRIPHYSPASLTALWKSKSPSHACRVLKYFFQRTVMCMEILDQAEIITKTAEFARVFGVDFASVLTRGSQYKVESFIFRIAKPESFVLVSPSKQQVGLQNAPFAVPLIAEPESKYYTHPVIVLDFQSLYPSIMIAYNICYSTCLGRVEMFKGTNKFGFTNLKVADGLLELLKDYLTVTPNGMIFVKPAIRKSLLAKMLGEILDTRVMIKHAMKGARDNKSLTAMHNARQLGLKLMANVTYGYTSATYSGRMPCIEIADSIVQTGRETLEKAQELIHSRVDWDARVVYGDTDSLFVALPGRSKEQAFKIGYDIADAVTALNPKPVKLKFEKVYMGSVLMAKKRYVGFKYEHPDETEPSFDAKGIETIRRDGFPAQQKMEEVCLKLLFRTQDLSKVKEFCLKEWTKILQGHVSIQDFIIAKEVRLGTYSEKGVPPPGAAVAYRRILKDPRDEPQYAERVPYLISNADGRRLIDRARMPEELLSSRSLGIDAEYYIRNLLIPPLSRIFNLVGADVEEWYNSMPKTKRLGKYDKAGVKMSNRGNGKGKQGRTKGSGSRIDSHFKSSHCVVCGIESSDVLCHSCRLEPSTTSHALLSRLHIAQDKLIVLQRICASCSLMPPAEKIMCDSIDCPNTFARVAAEREVEDLEDVGELLLELKLDDEKPEEDFSW